MHQPPQPPQWSWSPPPVVGGCVVSKLIYFLGIATNLTRKVTYFLGEEKARCNTTWFSWPPKNYFLEKPFLNTYSPSLFPMLSIQAWTWSVPHKGATLEAVQDIMLKYYQEWDLPVASWTDNGSQFRNLLAAAIEKTLGVRFRYIPPGRPCSNGLVECRNKILEATCGAQMD